MTDYLDGQQVLVCATSGTKKKGKRGSKENIGVVKTEEALNHITFFAVPTNKRFPLYLAAAEVGKEVGDNLWAFQKPIYWETGTLMGLNNFNWSWDQDVTSQTGPKWRVMNQPTRKTVAKEEDER